jgi:threonyl-tRNA synthetase
VILHRAILGSLERFIGILIEETAGSLPTWLAPLQAVVLNISAAQTDYAIKVNKRCQEAGIRIQTDLRNEKIGFKIREHTIQRVPYLLVIGDREVADNTVSVRTREGLDLGSLSIEEFINKLLSEHEHHQHIIGEELVY